jgi:trehalose 6-phosphate phosphatase
VADNSSPLPAPSPDLIDGATLLLDFDGTLVPLAETPEAVSVDPELRALLEALRDRLEGRLAIVSGRSVATLRERFGLEDFLIAGTHGLELGAPGQAVKSAAPMPEVDRAERAFEAFAKDRPGVLVERKTLSVALHYRLAPDCAGESRDIAEALAHETGLYIQHGKMLFELRPGGASKGTAVAALMQRPTMAGSRPIFIGDDVTDEEGFVGVSALNGFGILVGEPRDTAAQYILERVEAVRHYLSACAARLGESPPGH